MYSQKLFYVKIRNIGKPNHMASKMGRPTAPPVYLYVNKKIIDKFVN